MPFRHPFTTSKGTKTHQPALFVRLEQGGIAGWGEAPAISYYDVTVEGMAALLEERQAEIEELTLTDPRDFWKRMSALFPGQSFLLCALDMAAWDLHGKRERRALWDLWGLDKEEVPPSDYTIGIDVVPRMVEKMQALPWPVYKIKVGGAQDLQVLEALRAHTCLLYTSDAADE